MVEVLKHTIVLQVLLHNVCHIHQFNTSGSVHLKWFALEPEKWIMVWQLHALLEVHGLCSIGSVCTYSETILILGFQVFLFVTHKISYSAQALIHEVIPWIDTLTKHLDNFSDNLGLHPTIHMATM